MENKECKKKEKKSQLRSNKGFPISIANAPVECLGNSNNARNCCSTKRMLLGDYCQRRESIAINGFPLCRFIEATEIEEIENKQGHKEE